MNPNKSSKSAVLRDSVVSSIHLVSGSILIFIFGSIMIMALSEGILGLFVFALIFTALGVLFLVSGIRKNHLLRLFKRYISLLLTDSSYSIDRLSLNTGMTTAAIKLNLEKMIQKGYFANAVIDNSKNCLVFLDHDGADSKTAAQQKEAFLPDSAYEMVVCKGCGAPNKVVKGSLGECEFCGSQIKAAG